jgi:hypothetical protein
MANTSVPMDNQGYVQYYAADSLKISDSLFTERDIINLGITGGASTGASGCNIGFDVFFNIDLNLDLNLFDFSLSAFDPSMFNKVDSLSLEMAAINNMLIESILDMECCGIAGVYNSTMVPFFKFFAEDGGFMTALVRYAEVITAIRAIMEPLECLIRLVPGNPWFPVDFDYLAWIYGYFKEAKPFLDRILSGEIIDIMLNPVHNMRVKLQSCLGNGLSQGPTSQKFTEIGSPEQLQAISDLAARGDVQITDAGYPYKPEPTKPLPTDAIYIGGESSPLYKEHLAEYSRAKIVYDRYIKEKSLFEEEFKRRSEAQKTINNRLAVTYSTKSILKLNTSGLCGCIADAFDINDFSIDYTAIRASSDLFQLDGKTIKGLTNKAAGVSSTNRPADEQYTVKKEDLTNPATRTAIINAGAGAGPAKTSNIIQEKRSTPNPYAEYGVGGATIDTTVDVVVGAPTGSDPAGRMRGNDKSQEVIKQLSQEAARHQSNIDKQQSKYESRWKSDKKQAIYLIGIASRRVNTFTDKTTTAYKIALADLEVARSIYGSYYKKIPIFDFLNDPSDNKAVSKYLNEQAFKEMYPSEYWADWGGSATGTVADKVRIITNESILNRGTYFHEISKSSTKRQQLGRSIDTARNNIMNNISSKVPNETRLQIPCSCDNLLCRLINYIIQYVLGLFDRLIQQITNMIIQYLIPDWVRDLLRTLSDFLKCFLATFNIFNTITEIHNYSEQLLDSLRGRINNYPADPCFIPTTPFQDPNPSIPGDYISGLPETELGDDFDKDAGDGNTYIPSYPDPTNPGDDNTDYPVTPPIVIEPSVIIEPGDQGRPLPTFTLKCNYLEL